MKYMKMLINFPSTLMHELMHWFFAIFFSRRIISFTVLPNFEQGTAGQVEYIRQSGAGNILISVAPKWMWVLLSYLLLHFKILVLTDELFLYINLGQVDLLSPWTWLYIYLGFQLFEAGRLSRRDWSNIVEGAFSLSGAGLLLVVGILIYAVAFVF